LASSAPKSSKNVKSQNDAGLQPRLDDDIRILQSHQPFFAKMLSVVTTIAQEADRGHGDPHIGQESHAAAEGNG
jgi:hypothetical protein